MVLLGFGQDHEIASLDLLELPALVVELFLGVLEFTIEELSGSIELLLPSLQILLDELRSETICNISDLLRIGTAKSNPEGAKPLATGFDDFDRCRLLHS